MTDIEQFISERGVTRCPTAALLVTTAKIDPADSAALRVAWAAKELARAEKLRRGVTLAPRQPISQL